MKELLKPPRNTLNLRISAAEQNLIDRAAESMGKTRTTFILEAARRAAEEALLDKAVMSVDLEAYTEFVRRLEAPACSSARAGGDGRRPAPGVLRL